MYLYVFRAGHNKCRFCFLITNPQTQTSTNIQCKLNTFIPSSDAASVSSHSNTWCFCSLRYSPQSSTTIVFLYPILTGNSCIKKTWTQQITEVVVQGGQLSSYVYLPLCEVRQMWVEVKEKAVVGGVQTLIASLDQRRGICEGQQCGRWMRYVWCVCVWFLTSPGEAGWQEWMMCVLWVFFFYNFMYAPYLLFFVICFESG